MTDQDKYVDETLKKQIQESFGVTDEQLKARMERIEKTLTDDEFAGAEERMMAKFMARLAAEEKKAGKAGPATEAGAAEETRTAETEPEIIINFKTEVKVEAGSNMETETQDHVEIVPEAKDESSATSVAGKKMVHFGRKKVFLVAALAAAFAGALGVTGIGENSYFFREDKNRVEVIFDSGKNISDVSSLEEAYDDIKTQMECDAVFILSHIPKDMKFESLRFEDGRAIIKLSSDSGYFYFIQWKSSVETSMNTRSDRILKDSVRNEWLGTDLEYGENRLNSSEPECEAQIEKDGVVAWIFGKLPKQEFEKILKNLYFS